MCNKVSLPASAMNVDQNDNPNDESNNSLYECMIKEMATLLVFACGQEEKRMLLLLFLGANVPRVSRYPHILHI